MSIGRGALECAEIEFQVPRTVCRPLLVHREVNIKLPRLSVRIDRAAADLHIVKHRRQIVLKTHRLSNGYTSNGKVDGQSNSWGIGIHEADVAARSQGNHGITGAAVDPIEHELVQRSRADRRAPNEHIISVAPDQLLNVIQYRKGVD